MGRSVHSLGERDSDTGYNFVGGTLGHLSFQCAFFVGGLFITDAGNFYTFLVEERMGRPLQGCFLEG